MVCAAPRYRKSGFTLVVTLALMILITVIAVGLLTLSSVALRSTKASSAESIARNNAKMALMIALGELQKHTGPDQRVTAPADLAGDVGGIRLSAGKTPINTKSAGGIANGLSSVQPGTRYWTASWETVTPANPAGKIYTLPPGATNIKWLISGNEAAPNNFTPASSIASVSGSGVVADSAKAVILAGSNTIGPPSAGRIESYVAAPLVEILTTQQGVTNRGRYAWWIGDEGTKARINGVSPTAPAQASTYASLAGNRGGWEVVAGTANHPVPGGAKHQDLGKVATLPSYDLINGAPTVDTKQILFHGSTTSSRGVLADSLQGGLRIELNSSLTTGFPAATTFPNTPKAGSNIIPTAVAANIKGPKWDALKAFYTQSKSAAATKTLTVKTAGTGGYDITIAPIITDLRLLFGVRLTDKGNNSYGIIPCGKIAVALANPYPYPLEWKQDLELEIIDETPYTNNRDSSIYRGGALANQRFLGRGTSEPAVFNKAVFVISKDRLEPGEAKAFTLGGRLVRPFGDTSTQRIPMKPLASASPSNFEVCVELDQKPDEKFTGSAALDDRESWTTSQPTAELRLSGGTGNILRRVERMEFDNGFHLTTKNYVDYNTIRDRKMPFPLLLYSFQISQPGVRYDTLLPAPDMMGTRNSTLRTFADFNLRATKFGRLITSYAPPPYFFIITDDENELPFTPSSSSLPSQTGPGFTKDLAFNPLPWGRAPTSDVKKTVLFSFPKTFVSLAQFQHADLTGDDEFVSISQQPGNALGNSYATPFVKRRNSILGRANFIVSGISSMDPAISSTKVAANYYDMSYLLNAAMWDTFYFSPYSDSSASTGQTSPNMVVAFPPASSGDLQDPLNAASCLLIDGSFNVNCTSKEAWMALLASTRFQTHPSGDANTTDAMFPRSLEQPDHSKSPPTGVSPDSFSGYRRLTPQQIDQVATEIVKQVRLRGPFVSLSHFVNRTLIDPNPAVVNSAMLGRSGALQAALDIGGVNISPDGAKNAFQPRIATSDDKLKLQVDGDGPRADLLGVSGNQANGTRGTLYGGEEQDGTKVWAPQSKDLNVGACASIYADRKLLTDGTLIPEQGFRSTGIPGWVTQADVLQAIGPSLSARSDTFRIRTYGEALSPDGKTVLAKAYCEAIVQRTPHYLDPSNAPTVRNASLTDNKLLPVNKTFGRRYQIVSMRWLSSNEI